SALLQPISGHRSAQEVAALEPTKLAATEGLFVTRAHAPLSIGGIPDEATKTVKYAIEVPSGLSFLATNDPSATIPGLDEVPREDWPPLVPLHLSFEIMVGAGSAMAALAALTAFLWWRRK